jgi:hypothetical protein
MGLIGRRTRKRPEQWKLERFQRYMRKLKRLIAWLSSCGSYRFSKAATTTRGTIGIRVVISPASKDTVYV